MNSENRKRIRAILENILDNGINDYEYDEFIKALAVNGYAIVPVEIPHEILGEAALSPVSQTGNPKHLWDWLIAKIRIL